MKVIAVALCFLGLAYADYVVRTAEDLGGFRTECSGALNIPAEKVEGFKKWQFEDDELTRKYILCVFQKFPIYELGKGIIVDNLVSQLAAGSDKTRDEITTEVTKCVDKRGDSEDEAAYCFRQFVCFKKAHLPLIRASVKKRLIFLNINLII